MTKFRALISLLLLGLSLPCVRAAEPADKVVIEGEADWDQVKGIVVYTNGVVVKSGDLFLTAKRATVYEGTSDVYAEGSVHILRDDQTWVGEHFHYNWGNGTMDGEDFRAGKAPMYMTGQTLTGDYSNHTYFATNAIVTAEDYERPLFRIRAKRLKLVPKEYFEVHDATFYAGNQPVFFLPYYRRSFGRHEENFAFLPGYRSEYGPYLLTTFNWYLNENLDGAVHLDERVDRGFGVGPD